MRRGTAHVVNGTLIHHGWQTEILYLGQFSIGDDHDLFIIPFLDLDSSACKRQLAKHPVNTH